MRDVRAADEAGLGGSDHRRRAARRLQECAPAHGGAYEFPSCSCVSLLRHPFEVWVDLGSIPSFAFLTGKTKTPRSRVASLERPPDSGVAFSMARLWAVRISSRTRVSFTYQASCQLAPASVCLGKPGASRGASICASAVDCCFLERAALLLAARRVSACPYDRSSTARGGRRCRRRRMPVRRRRRRHRPARSARRPAGRPEHLVVEIGTEHGERRLVAARRDIGAWPQRTICAYSHAACTGSGLRRAVAADHADSDRSSGTCRRATP